MKKLQTEKMGKVVNDDLIDKPVIDTNKYYFGKGYIARMRGLFMLPVVIGVMLLFNSCATPGYISYEPTYMEYQRPQRPDNVSIWIDGDWNWDYQTRQYHQMHGYWEKPRHGQTHIVGKWETSPKGKSWSKGYWQSDGHKTKNNRY